MKVIDMLDRIANGEEVPHFKIFEIEYFLNDRGVLREKEEDRPSEDTRWFIDSKWLNTEVEIIEEDKKIENIGTIYFNETPTEAILHRKIEEIIDYINKEKNIDRTRRQTTNK